MNQQFYEKIADCIAKHPNYAPEAYELVADAVTYTVKKLEKQRHVSALELLQGIREYAKMKYGAVYETVLKRWGLHTALHVGEVVYLLIGAELLAASAEDSPEDFNVEFSWEEQRSFRRPSNLPFID